MTVKFEKKEDDSFVIILQHRHADLTIASLNRRQPYYNGDPVTIVQIVFTDQYIVFELLDV